MSIRFIRLPEVKRRTGLSRATIYLRISQGNFPRQIPLGDIAVGWIEAEIDQWCEERVRTARDTADAIASLTET